MWRACIVPLCAIVAGAAHAAGHLQPLQLGEELHGGRRITNVTAIPQSYECAPVTGSAIGSVQYHIQRTSDGACIGEVSWPVLPQPEARIGLAAQWCGGLGCEAVVTTGLVKDSWPERFQHGIRLLRGEQAWLLETTPGSAMVERVLPEIKAAETTGKRGDRYRLEDLPSPLGVYAVILGQTDLQGLGARGDAECLAAPTVFIGGGRILSKQRGQAINGNPYKIAQYFECSSWEGETSCQSFTGRPEAPMPGGVSAGYDYTALGAGDFKMCLQGSKEANCALLYACVREDGAIAHDRRMENGDSLIKAMLALWDGTQPSFTYLDSATLQLKE